MKKLLAGIVALAVLGGCAMAPSNPSWSRTAMPSPAALRKVRREHNYEIRLARVAHRLDVRDATQCKSHAFVLPVIWDGYTVGEKTGFKEAFWQLYHQVPGDIYVEGGFGSQAARAAAGDEILAIGSHTLAHPIKNGTPLLKWLYQAAAYGKLHLTLKNHGKVALPVEVGCSGYPAIYPTMKNAVVLSKGPVIMMTEKMESYAQNDDELAYLYSWGLYRRNSNFYHVVDGAGYVMAGIWGALQFAFLPLLVVPAWPASVAVANIAEKPYQAPSEKAAFHYMVGAGYDPRVMPEWWAKLAKEKGVPGIPQLRPSASLRNEWLTLIKTLTPAELERIASAHRKAPELTEAETPASKRVIK